MKIAYDLFEYKELEILLPIELPIESHIHYLITGSSGSGKTFSLIYLLTNLVREVNLTIWLFDFKNSSDFSFLKGYPKYACGDECVQGIIDYYNYFCSIRKGEILEAKRQTLIVDEFPSLINYLTNLDKENKTKIADKILRYISEILMLGRGLGFGVWIVTQRADATLFPGGSRDNFMVIIGLGRISKEQKQMLFSSQDLEEKTYSAGEGIIFADGQELQEIKFPRITNIDKAKAFIKRKLMLNAHT